ncbi:MAG: hypothetical protein JO225_01315 [Candidatus Eremiobacteraeota bacterium]|nr:hypothetical protein [Candidatus Eremiobacteraeota bacterium]
MKGDLSRAAFDVHRYTRVVAQQGRIQLDADWNEQQAIVDHRLRTALADVFGGGEPLCVAVVPHAAPGFGVHLHDGYAFDGTMPGVAPATDPGSFGSDAPYTVEMWLRAAPLAPGASAVRRTIVARTSGDVNAPGEFRIALDADDRVVFERWELAAQASAVALTSRRPLTAGAFAFVACVFTGSTVELWIDGVLDSRANAGPGAAHDGLALRIGDSFAGTLEAVRVWKRRRHGHEIVAAYLQHDVRHADENDVPALAWRGADAADAAHRARAELCVSPGRAYANGWLCENARHAPFADPLPAGESTLYLDVWERYVSAFEDPSIGDVALGGIDTTGRAQTVAQVRAATPDAFGALCADEFDRGEIAVGVGTGILQDNLLYRFEVHAPGGAADDRADPNAVTVEHVRAADRGRDPRERTLRVVGDADVTWPSGQYLQVLDPAPTRKLMRVVSWNAPDADGKRTFTVDEVPDGVAGEVRVRPVASVLWSRSNGNVVFALAGSPAVDERTSTIILVDDARRSNLLSVGDVVVIADETDTMAFRSGFVSTIRDITANVPGRIQLVVGGRIDGVGEGAVLRTWDGIVPADAFDPKPRPVGDLTVNFARGGMYRCGDYWNALLRPDAVDNPLRWPHDQDGRPSFAPPAGVTHTFAELARVRVDDDGPHIEHDLRRLVRSVAELVPEHAPAPGDDEPIDVQIGRAEPHTHEHDEPDDDEPISAIVVERIVERAVDAELVLARSAPAGYVAAGSVVEARVDDPTWTPAPDAPDGGAATAVAIDGVLYVLYERGSLWRRDPSHPDNPWEQCRPYEGVRRDYAVTAAGGCLYVLGGLDQRGRPSALVDTYDPRTDTWSDMTPRMHAARARFAAAGNDRSLVVFGGVRRTWFGFRYVSETAEEFDLTDAVWYRLRPMPDRRYGSAAAFVGGAVYLIGGMLTHSVWSRPRTPTARVDRLHFGSGRWTHRLPLHEPRAYARAAVVGDEEIVVAGGADPATEAERIRVGSGEVRRLPAPGREAFGLAAVDGIVYAVAGEGGSRDRHDVARLTLVDRIRVYRRGGSSGKNSEGTAT